MTGTPYLYHGRSAGDDRFAAIRDGVIEGERIPISVVDTGDVAWDKEYVGVHIESTEWTLVDEYEATLTGGISGNFGTAVHFSTYSDKPGIAFVLDPDRLPADLEPIQYGDFPFAAEHPGVYARIDTLLDGEAHSTDGQFVGAGRYDNGRLTLQHTGERLEYEVESFPYTGEDEYIVYGRDSIAFDSAIVASATHLHTGRGSRARLGENLAAYDGFTYNKRFGEETDANRRDPEPNAIDVYDRVAAELPPRMTESYYVAVHDEGRFYDKDGEVLDPSTIDFVYDGTEVIYDDPDLFALVAGGAHR